MAETDAELMVSIIAESDWESPFVIKEFKHCFHPVSVCLKLSDCFQVLLQL